MYILELLFCEFFLSILAYLCYVKNEKIFCYIIIFLMIIIILSSIIIKFSCSIDNEGFIISNLNNFKNKIFWQHIKKIELINISGVKHTGIEIDEQYEQLYINQMTEKQIKVYMSNKKNVGCGICIMGTLNLKSLQKVCRVQLFAPISLTARQFFLYCSNLQ